MTTPRWKIDLGEGGRGTVEHNGSPIPDIRKITIECEAGETPKIFIELTRANIELSLADAGVAIKPFVQVIVGTNPTWNMFNAISLEQFLEIQQVADKHSFSIEDCCHAFALLQKMGETDAKMLEIYCEMAKDSGEPVNLTAQRCLDLVGKLEGAP